MTWIKISSIHKHIIVYIHFFGFDHFIGDIANIISKNHLPLLLLHQIRIEARAPTARFIRSSEKRASFSLPGENSTLNTTTCPQHYCSPVPGSNRVLRFGSGLFATRLTDLAAVALANRRPCDATKQPIADRRALGSRRFGSARGSRAGTRQVGSRRGSIRLRRVTCRGCVIRDLAKGGR